MVLAAQMMAEEKEAKAAKKAAKKEKKEIPRIPGEGDPFGEIATAYSIANRDGGSAFQPRGISDATVIKPQYIETEDEPWCARSTPCLGSPFML